MNGKERKYTLVLDAGTTGMKGFVFDADYVVVASAYEKLQKSHLSKGWVEQDPEEIISKARKVLSEVIKTSNLNKKDLIGFGITNQRETTIVWRKSTGEPVYPAIVWEDTRTSEYCARLKEKHERSIRQRTGLYIDPYFSASKIWWILNNVPETGELAKKKDLLFGTVDTWILWNLCDGQPHITDYTNASRTLLFDIRRLKWDSKISKIFGVPSHILPKVQPSQSIFGSLADDVVGFELPIMAVCGDQQASLYAIGISPGTTKATYGTGVFIMQSLGESMDILDPFFTTLIPSRGEAYYALEAKVSGYGEIKSLLKKPKKLKAVLEKLANDTGEYIKKMPFMPKELIVDGGITRLEQLVSIQAKVIGIPVNRQEISDGTALGVAKLISEQNTAH
ncbi:MAG: FGGY family carbohydrate kinase [Candidatus Taylorbacteria bacterium]|nr:FGGY family carbohydrate kinase [Candidatus Taylorbacteria bacterium]